MDMQKLLQQAQQMQQQVAEAQASLAKESVEASAGGGMVRVTATGAGDVTSIKIDAEAVDPDDIELLEDMVLAAVNEAHRMASDLQQQRMGGIMPGGGGLGLPGM